LTRNAGHSGITFDELQLWDCINETLKWSRLYGGAVALILIEGQAPLTPLVLDKVGKGSLKAWLFSTAG
jgi:hypothetical protein